MLSLITGVPGSFKTCLAVSKTLDMLKNEPERLIFTNIKGLTIANSFNKKSDADDDYDYDYRNYPKGSIIIYDEAQNIKFFRFGFDASKNDIVQSLQTHRHHGYDIFFITQHPKLLNSWVTNLIGQHFNCFRAYGLPQAKVHVWNTVNLNPYSKSEIRSAPETFNFAGTKKIYDLYKSAEVHTHKFVFPQLLKKKIIFLLVLLALAVYFFSKQDVISFSKMKNAISTTKIGDTKQSPVSNNPTTSNKLNSPSPTPVPNTTSSNNNASMVKVNFSYDASMPFDVDYSKIDRQPVQLPVFSGCMSMHKVTKCYTTAGTQVTLSNSDANRVLNGETPFNPFKQAQPQTYNNVENNNKEVKQLNKLELN
jgi:zona occludens toxin (predicted ATPase)